MPISHDTHAACNKYKQKDTPKLRYPIFAFPYEIGVLLFLL